MVDYEVAVDLGCGEVDDRHDTQEYEQAYGDDRDAGPRYCSFAVFAGHCLVEVDGPEALLEAGEHGEYDYD